MKSSEILSIAADHISSRKAYFLCDAIRVTVHEKNSDIKDKGDKLIKWVEDQLDGHDSLDKWFEVQYKRKIYSDKMTIYRLFWANTLIDICKMEND